MNCGPSAVSRRMPGHDARRRDRDVPRAEAEPARIVERLDRGQDPVEVEQRLAHAHEHDVREPAAFGRQPALGVARLVDDLGDLEVAPEPELAGGTERAADRAAGLARDAQRVPFAGRAARRVVHQHRLDEGAVVEPMEGLLGLAAVGQPDLGVRDRVEPEVVAPARRAADAGSVRIAAASVDAAVLPDGVGDLAGAVRRLALRLDPGGQLVRREAGDPGRRGRSVTGRCYCRRSPAGRGRRRPRTSALPPAGWTSTSRSRPPSPVPNPSPSKVPDAADRRAAPARPRQTMSRPSGRLDERARPRLVGADLALQLGRRSRVGSRRPSSRRSGRVSVAPSSGCGGRRSCRAATDRDAAASRSAAATSQRRLELRRRSRRRRARTASAPRSGPVSSPASMRIRVTPVSVSPARIAAGMGVAPRCRGSSDGWRLSAPCATVEQRRPARSGRSRRGRSGPVRSASSRRSHRASRSRSGVRIGRTSEVDGGVVDRRRRHAATAGRPVVAGP